MRHVASMLFIAMLCVAVSMPAAVAETFTDSSHMSFSYTDGQATDVLIDTPEAEPFFFSLNLADDEGDDEEVDDDEDEDDEIEVDEEVDDEDEDDEEDNDEIEDILDDAADEDFNARLKGKNEVPPVVTDGEGKGSFFLLDNDLYYLIEMENLSSPVTGAHFHHGAEGVSGPVVEPITVYGNSAFGVWLDLTPEEVDRLMDEEIYVNVHTENFPGGEVRAQVD